MTAETQNKLHVSSFQTERDPGKGVWVQRVGEMYHIVNLRTGEALRTFTESEWVAFVRGAQAGEFDFSPITRIPRKKKKEMKRQFPERTIFSKRRDGDINVFTRKRPHRQLAVISLA